MSKLSGGQQRRLDVAIALAGDPELLFLDEPTTGFDPNARRHAWEIVKNLADIGKTIFLTTHFMDEAQYLANRVAVIAQGRDRGGGEPRRRWAAAIGCRRGSGSGSRTARRHRRSLTDATTLADGSLEVRTDDPTKAVHDLTAWALERGLRRSTGWRSPSRASRTCTSS